MCGLCGAFGQKMHWTDKVNEQQNKETDTHISRIERAQRLAILNSYLKHKGIKVRDWQNTRFILENLTGRTEIAEDIFDVWAKVKDMLGYSFDPLEFKHDIK